MDKSGPGKNRPRKPNSRYIKTSSGRALKVNSSLGARFRANRDAKSRRRAQRLQGLPKSRVKRILWRLEPRRMYHYWFSRDGGIMALKLLGVFILVMFILSLGVFAYFRKDLPNIKDISGSNLGGSISYYDKTGTTLLWQDYNAVKRVPVTGDNMAPSVKEATVAIEDRDFYNHRGFDIRGITRAAVNDTLKHGSTQGGSTITQQLVKLTQDFNQNRSIALKAKELILAVELERTYSKDEILTGYLNAAPYGSVDYGVQAAASDYFHKSAKDLTLAESAFLAAIPKSPAYYSPYSPYFEKQALVTRQHYVLDVMVQTGKITKAQADEAKKVDVVAEVQPQQTKYAGIQAPYFVLAAKAELTAKFVPSDGNGSAKIGGWKVTTTLDSGLQKLAEDKVRDNTANATKNGADEQAIAAEDVKTGQMVALVGGTDFSNADHGQINYAQHPIPPGSSFKPYDYATMIDNTTNSGAGSVLYDVQQPLPGYPCTNKTLPPPKGQGNCLEDYDFKYPGALTLRYALAGSRNVPAVKAMLTVGTDKVISTANAMMNAPGAYNCYSDTALTKKTQCYGASAIGDGAFLHLDQHVNGLSTLARLGQAIPATYILKIEDSSNKNIYQWTQPKAKQVIRPESAYIVNNILSDPSASYLPSGYYKYQHYGGWNIAVKTGTTNDNYDGLMTAWTTKYAVASWVGYHTRDKPLTAGAMEYVTTPLTRGWITGALDQLHTTPVNWTPPSGLKTLPAYVVRNHVGVGSVEPSPSNDIFPSWYQTKTTSTQSQTIDKVSNKLATDCTPALAKQTVGGNATADAFSSDKFYGAGATAGASTTNKDDVHLCSDAQPSISSFSVTALGGGQYQLSATAAAGTHPLSSSQYPGAIAFTIDGQPVSGCPNSCAGNTDGNGSVSITFTNSTYSGLQNVVATVTDSVLYQAASTPQATSFSPGGGGSLAMQAASASSTAVTFNWTGGTGPFSVYRSSSNTLLCGPTNNNSCQASLLLAPHGVSVYVKDSTGATDNGTVP